MSVCDTPAKLSSVDRVSSDDGSSGGRLLLRIGPVGSSGNSFRVGTWCSEAERLISDEKEMENKYSSFDFDLVLGMSIFPSVWGLCF
jgi:hypothetical protein